MYGPFYLANTGAMLFGKWIPDRLGFDSLVIDRGRTLGDGFRVLGDGKTWNGFFGGAFFSGILAILSHNFFRGRSEPGSSHSSTLHYGHRRTIGSGSEMSGGRPLQWDSH